MLDRPVARLAALALVALVLFNFPTLAVVERIVAGDVPLLPFYLFGVWAVVIGAAAWLIERQGEE
ncbi:MAG: hypothetical protein K6T74_03415 [Geminicoccaceae bacterium]|nr:hypothetical protein [Geminicoccaceae bacterium]